MATEDFTTYTETDADSKLSVLASIATFTAAATRYKTYNLYYDKGAGHFGNFTHLITILTHNNTAGGTSMETTHWMVSNQTGDGRAGEVSTHGLQVYSYGYTGSPYQFAVYDHNSGNADYYIATPASLWYCTISRSSTTLQMLIYSDSGRTSLTDTVSVSCETTTYRYISAISGYNDGVGTTETDNAYTKDLDLQESVAATVKQLAALGVG